MYIDPDKLKGQQTLGVLDSAMTDLTDHIENVQEALAIAADSDYDREEREEARETISSSLEELFGEFEALQRICVEKLS